jgi:hypothetical protein
LAPRVGIIVAALGAIPLLFALLPILAPIFGAVLTFTTAMLQDDSGNLQVNALLPWFAVGFALAPFVIIYLGSDRAFGRLRGGR